MAKDHLIRVTDEHLWLYEVTRRAVGQEVADELYPGIREYLARRRAGVKERAYVPAGPDRSAIDPALTTRNPVEARPSQPSRRPSPQADA